MNYEETLSTLRYADRCAQILNTYAMASPTLEFFLAQFIHSVLIRIYIWHCRAKRIQNKAKINESPTDKLIRELKEENAKLMSQLMNTLGGGRGAAAKTDGKCFYFNQWKKRRHKTFLKARSQHWVCEYATLGSFHTNRDRDQYLAR